MLGMGGAVGSLALSAPTHANAKPAANATPDFEEIPNSATGITWVHDAGLSPSMYLPETMGAGCAVIDYNNDGWMDIYLVNSGACDFYTPAKPLRNALYHNNRDGTFTDVTEKAGVPGNASTERGDYGCGHGARSPCWDGEL